jgi:glycosyltransferase involved in cell wall biosynthesis
MDVLILSAHLPSPVSSEGGNKTCYHFAEFFAQRHRIHLLAFATEVDRAKFRSSDMSIFHCWDHIPWSNVDRAKGVLSNPGLPLQIAARASLRFRHKLRQLLSTHSFDFAFLDFTQMLQYCDSLSSVPVVTVNEHDVLFQSLDRKLQKSSGLRRRALGFEYQRMKRWELDAASSVTFVTVQNPKDRALLEANKVEPPILCMDPWVDSVPAARSKKEWEKEAASIVFFGAMGRKENSDAVIYACNDIFPLIMAKTPHAHYYIGGSYPPASVLDLASPNVTVSGFVDNFTEYLATKEIALIPLRLGAGIKSKVLECFAVRTPVVTTPVGIEGINVENDRHVIVRNTPRELADAVVMLLNNPTRRLELAKNAHQWFIDHYSWYKPLEDLEGFVESNLTRR